MPRRAGRGARLAILNQPAGVGLSAEILHAAQPDAVIMKIWLWNCRATFT
jgi:hypothetical protein